MVIDKIKYRECKRIWAKTEAQKKYRKEYMRLWREKNKNKYNAWARDYYSKNKDKWKSRKREYRLVRMYNITTEEYNNMFEKQKGTCYICGKEPVSHAKNKNSKVLHIDHNHETGKVRGLLCSKCNGALGWYEKYKLNIEIYLNR